MRTLLFLLQKEFLQIMRNTAVLRIIFMMPAMQLLVLPHAADYETKNIHVAVVDQDHSPWSQRLIGKMQAGGYFQIAAVEQSWKKSLGHIEADAADVILEIPAGFEHNLVREGKSRVFVAVNAINGVKANLGAAYLMSVIREFNAEIRAEAFPAQRFSLEPRMEILSMNWFNPEMNYKIFMVPGILVILVTMIGTFMASQNIVREKEIGTIEQLNVTPIFKWQFVLGKMIPFWVMGMVVLSIGMGIAWLVYGIVPVGSMGVIYAFAAIYMVAVLGFGLFISTISDTQQQAMFTSFFFILIFILLGGLYTSTEGMPTWAQMISRINPVTYFIEVMRMVVLKGSGFADLGKHFLIISCFAVVTNGVAVWNYRKRA